MRGVLWTGRGPRYLYGRPSGGYGDQSRLSAEPEDGVATDKIAGPYFAPFLDVAGRGSGRGTSNDADPAAPRLAAPHTADAGAVMIGR